jgi:hypothetical protein
MESGLCLCVFEGHSSMVRSVGWSPDGDQALSSAVNGVISGLGCDAEEVQPTSEGAQERRG